MLNAEMSGAEITEFIRELIAQNYALGEIRSVEAIREGDTNNSYFACAERDGVLTKWYVRQYNPAVEERELLYEHTFERYYNANVHGEMQTEYPVLTKSGATWVRATYGGQENFYAVFSCISGLEPYHWEYNRMPPKAVEESIRAVAKFHTWACGFEAPEGSGKREPPLEEQFRIWRKELPRSMEEKRQQDRLYFLYNQMMAGEYGFFMEMVDFVEKRLADCKEELIISVCHKDIQPANLMYDAQDHVTAIFDLDWVNYDYRLYDLAWMGYWTIASWNYRSLGQVSPGEIKTLVNYYNDEMRRRNRAPGPLTEKETAFLPVMMLICVLKVVIDMSVYEDHSEEPHRLFVNVWRLMESAHSLYGILQEGD